MTENRGISTGLWSYKGGELTWAKNLIEDHAEDHAEDQPWTESISTERGAGAV